MPLSTTFCAFASNDAVTPVVAVAALIFATRLVPSGGATPSSIAAPGASVMVAMLWTPLTEPLMLIEKLPVLSAAGVTANAFGVPSVVGAGDAGRPCGPYTTAPALLIAAALWSTTVPFTSVSRSEISVWNTSGEPSVDL